MTIRRADGAIVVVGDVSPYPATLYDLIYRKKWEEAIKLCRFAKDQPLWACLAGLAISGNDLNTAEVAYAALEEVIPPFLVNPNFFICTFLLISLT